MLVLKSAKLRSDQNLTGELFADMIAESDMFIICIGPCTRSD